MFVFHKTLNNKCTNDNNSNYANSMKTTSWEANYFSVWFVTLQGNRRFFPVFTSTCLLSIPEPDKSNPHPLSYLFKINFSIILFSTSRYSKWPSSFKVLSQTPAHVSLLSHMCHTLCVLLLPWFCEPHIWWGSACYFFHDFVNLISGEEYKPWRRSSFDCISSDCISFQPPVVYSFLDPNIFPSTLSSNNISLCFYVGDQVSHP